MSSQCDFYFEVDLPVTFACSKLSGGPFFFFSPLSIPGYLLSRVIRQIPYLHMGNSWALKNKYEGMGVYDKRRTGSIPRPIPTQILPRLDATPFPW